MMKSTCILVSLSLMAAVVCLASTVSAECATCGGGAEENWAASAASFLEGKSIENVPAPKWGPAAARETNSQFSSNNNTEGNADKASEESSSTPEESSIPEKTTAQNVDQLNVNASPNPANPGNPVNIAAAPGMGENTTAYAIIRNFAGVQVGNVTLEKASGNEYVGTWDASIATGTYTVSIVASESGVSRTFENVLQIEVVDSSGTSDTSSRFKKLG